LWIGSVLRAPGIEAGHGVETVPTVREAIGPRHRSEAEHCIVRTAKALVNAR